MTATDRLPRPRFARMYIEAAASAERARRHRAPPPPARGAAAARVVEIGAGHGLNFPHYPPTVTEVDRDRARADAARRGRAGRGRRAGPDPRAAPASPTSCRSTDASVDAAVASLVLCSVPDQARALAEIRRVLRPGGELRFYEHVIPRCQPKRVLLQARRPQRPLAGDRRRLPPRPRHHRRDRGGRLRHRAIERFGFRRQRARARVPHILGIARRR